jgi:GMP synthase-like glutamine amidotransferase
MVDWIRAVGMTTVLFVQHQANVPPGLAGVWARSAGLAARVLRVEDGTRYPDPHEFAAIVVLGSSASVYDASVPWVAPELAFVRAAVLAPAPVPVLGICFGGQLLSAALGGEVRRAADGGETGWSLIQTDAPDWIAPGPWVQSHGDVFTVPPGATELARSASGPQAFRSGPHLGLQFHPEVDEAIGMDWARDASGSIARRGLDPAVFHNDPDGWAAARVGAMRLFDTWWAAATAPKAATPR